MLPAFDHAHLTICIYIPLLAFPLSLSSITHCPIPPCWSPPPECPYALTPMHLLCHPHLFSPPPHICSCPICFDDVLGLACVRLPDCGHTFCTACFSTHCRLLAHEGAVDNVRCAEPSCRLQVPPHVLRGLLTEVSGGWGGEQQAGDKGAFSRQYNVLGPGMEGMLTVDTVLFGMHSCNPENCRTSHTAAALPPTPPHTGGV